MGAAAQLQRQEIWNIDAIISLKNINATAGRILADQRRQISAIQYEHPQLDCKILMSNLSVLREINNEESRLLSLSSAILPTYVDDL